MERDSIPTENEAFINAGRDFGQEGAWQVSAVNDLFTFWAWDTFVNKPSRFCLWHMYWACAWKMWHLCSVLTALSEARALSATDSAAPTEPGPSRIMFFIADLCCLTQSCLSCSLSNGEQQWCCCNCLCKTPLAITEGCVEGWINNQHKIGSTRTLVLGFFSWLLLRSTPWKESFQGCLACSWHRDVHTSAAWCHPSRAVVPTGAQPSLKHRFHTKNTNHSYSWTNLLSYLKNLCFLPLFPPAPVPQHWLLARVQQQLWLQDVCVNLCHSSVAPLWLKYWYCDKRDLADFLGEVC